MKKILFILTLLIMNLGTVLSKDIKNNNFIQSETTSLEAKNLDNEENVLYTEESSSKEIKNTSTAKNKKKTFGGDLLKGLKSCAVLLFLTFVLSLTKAI